MGGRSGDDLLERTDVFPQSEHVLRRRFAGQSAGARADVRPPVKQAKDAVGIGLDLLPCAVGDHFHAGIHADPPVSPVPDSLPEHP